MRIGTAAFAAAALLSTTMLASADNVDTLSAMKSTGTPMSALKPVPQGGPKADAINKTLAKIKLPPGFKISLYALVPDARMIAVGPQGVVTFVSTRKDKIYSVKDSTNAGVADDVKEFAPVVAKKNPNAICFSKDGILYSAEQNRVVAYPGAEFFYETPDVAIAEVVKQGDLIPKEEESFNHSARVCRIGPDNKLYVALGQPFNVPPAAKQDLYYKDGIGGIVRMDRDGSNREVFAHGIRNSVGMDFAPDKTLWFTDNQVDGMGDDQPPGEINHAPKAGMNFGFPWYGGGHVRTVEYKDQTPPTDITFPVVEEAPHAADLGMNFYKGDMFPAQYKGAIFSAQHGSWNRTVPVGARVMVTTIKPDGTATSTPFAEGWLDEDGSYLGRPVDVAPLRDGSLLVSDDFAGAVYRITYDASAAK